MGIRQGAVEMLVVSTSFWGADAKFVTDNSVDPLCVVDVRHGATH